VQQQRRELAAARVDEIGLQVAAVESPSSQTPVSIPARISGPGGEHGQGGGDAIERHPATVISTGGRDIGRAADPVYAAGPMTRRPPLASVIT
jgi:hypothetical protein